MATLLKKCRHPRPDWPTCRCAWYIRRRVGGRLSDTNVGPNLVDAERALVRAERTIEETVTQTVDAWLAAKEAEPNARQGSLDVYKVRARWVRNALGDNPTRSLRPEHLALFVSEMQAYRDAKGRPISPAYVKSIYAVLTASLRHARRRGVIPHLPLPEGGVGIGGVVPREHRLTLGEVEAVIERMPGVWGQVAELILLTGLRFGEAVAIERQDIEGLALRVQRTRTRGGGTNPPKTRAGVRVVPLSPRAAEILDGLQLPVGGDYRMARKALVAAIGDLHRPGVGWHSLRNAHATLLEEAGVTLRDQAARLGHGHSYAVTLAYGLRGEAGRADALDAVRQRPSPRSVPDELAPRRARRRGPPAG